MEDQYRKKYIKLFGHLVFKQQRKGPDGKMQERILTAEHAEYNGKSEILELYGQVDGRDFNGSELHAPDGMTVNTKEGEETIEGKNGTFKFAPEEDTGDDAESGGKDAKGAADKNKKGQR
jgi:lipopolysaccharide export system protein LptA